MRSYGVEIEVCDCIQENAPLDWEREYEHCGLEYVSPILSGPRGLQAIRDLYKRIQPKVNNSCGLHVHVDVRDFDDNEKLELAKRLRADKRIFADKVDSSRLNNPFCDGDLPAVHNRDTFYDYTQRLRGDRYFWCNLLSVYKHGTIEFRLHEATENADKVCAWVEFLVSYVDNVRTGLIITECPADVNKEHINNCVDMLVSNCWSD